MKEENHLIKDFKPLVALVLADINRSVLTGLRSKYPLAWANKNKYQYNNSRIFTWGTLEREYYARLAYVLLEYSEQNEELKQEINRILKKQFIKIDKTCSKYERGSRVCRLEISEMFYNLTSVNSGGALGLCLSISIIEYFFDIYGLMFEVEGGFSDIKKNIESFMVQSVYLPHSLKGYNLSHSKYDNSYRKEVQFAARKMIEIYSEYIEEDVMKFLPKCVEESVLLSSNDLASMDVHLFQWFGHDYNSLLKVRSLQKEDIEQIFYFLLNEIRKFDIAEEDSLEFINQNILSVAVRYVFAKSYAYDRDYFFEMQSSKEQLIIQGLDNELRREKEKREKIEFQFEKASNEIALLKSDKSKLINDSVKVVQSELSEMNKRNRDLENEIAELKKSLVDSNKRVEELENEMNSDVNYDDLGVSEQEIIDHFNHAGVLIVPGHPNLVSKMKQVLPKATYYEIGDNYKKTFFNGTEKIFMTKKYMNHVMSNKLKVNCPDIRQNRITKTKVSLLLKEMAELDGFI